MFILNLGEMLSVVYRIKNKLNELWETNFAVVSQFFFQSYIYIILEEEIK